MKAYELKEQLEELLEKVPEALNAEMKVALWDDNPFDGKTIQGLRLNLDISEQGKEWSVFVIET